MSEVVVDYGGGSYPVIIERGALERLAARLKQLAPERLPLVISDRAVADAWPGVLPGVPRLTFPSGEVHKTRATWTRLTDELGSVGADRNALVVALGGGVTTDLAGFVAATFMRGVPWVAVPTSTLAMCDAAIGGKTGVDTDLGKNLVGAFHQPLAVVIDPEVLATLPDPIYLAGLAEAVKHAAILDVSHWDWISDHVDEILQRESGSLASLIATSVRIKAAVVSEDVRESGRRAILNAGHTMAHAIEQASDYLVPHGHAVAVGLVIESRIGESLGITKAGTAVRIGKLLAALDLPIIIPDGIDQEKLLRATLHDKKNVAGEVRAVLLAEVGRVFGDSERGWTVPIPEKAILHALWPRHSPHYSTMTRLP